MYVFLLFTFLTSCTSNFTEEPTVTLEGYLSNAIEAMDAYYTKINSAQTEDDLTEPWNMWTLDAQCNPREQCSLFRFQDMRWPNKVLYKLYDCGSNRVIAEEMKYPRDADESEAGVPEYWKYQLVEFDGAMVISGVRKTQALGDDCALAVY